MYALDLVETATIGVRVWTDLDEGLDGGGWVGGGMGGGWYGIVSRTVGLNWLMQYSHQYTSYMETSGRVDLFWQLRLDDHFKHVRRTPQGLDPYPGRSSSRPTWIDNVVPEKAQ